MDPKECGDCKRCVQLGAKVEWSVWGWSLLLGQEGVGDPSASGQGQCGPGVGHSALSSLCWAHGVAMGRLSSP